MMTSSVVVVSAACLRDTNRAVGIAFHTPYTLYLEVFDDEAARASESGDNDAQVGRPLVEDCKVESRLLLLGDACGFAAFDAAITAAGRVERRLL